MESNPKYLDMAGLQVYDGLIKGIISDENAKSFKSFQYDQTTRTLKFFKVENPEPESTPDFSESKPVSEIKGKKFLHLADLLNQSASFTRAWIPAIKNLGSNIVWSIFAVDRMQGGTETLTNDGVKVLSLLQIDESLFTTAKEL